jgi:hypothetical protein
MLSRSRPSIFISYFQQNIANHFSKMKACAPSCTHSWEALQKRWNVHLLSLVSVSQSNLRQVERYIANQEQHHRKISFQDEVRALLTKHEIKWDERYIWE